MIDAKSYFFCGIGGSGMLPLACILRAGGAEVAGSDRALDQGRLSDKFAFLQRQGIGLFPQDGSGVTSADQLVVTSAAIEETVPDVVAAGRVGAKRMTRPQLLATLFNAAETSIGVAGTSGKSTTTGMIAWVLHALGRAPTVMNGAVMKNFATADAPFASALVGGNDLFVSEIDESDGSIALYRPKVAVLNNITLDHKSMEELRALFLEFAGKADKVVVNLDDEEVRELAKALPQEKLVTFSVKDSSADYFSLGMDDAGEIVRFSVAEQASGETRLVALHLWGAHNGYNAMAAIAAVTAAGVPFSEAIDALTAFSGIRRRFEVVGEQRGVLVIDDFAHNPDKIAASLQTGRGNLQGRLLIFFQPHGYGPLRLMKDALIRTFADGMAEGDVLVMPDPVYFGGTTDRGVGSAEIVAGVTAAGRDAMHIADRQASGERLAALARAGDRIVIMGARDDTLSQFAAEVLALLRGQAA